jgi:hypothetical protein
MLWLQVPGDHYVQCTTGDTSRAASKMSKVIFMMGLAAASPYANSIRSPLQVLPFFLRLHAGARALVFD